MNELAVLGTWGVSDEQEVRETRDLTDREKERDQSEHRGGRGAFPGMRGSRTRSHYVIPSNS
jgi:hypothetical protein